MSEYSGLNFNTRFSNVLIGVPSSGVGNPDKEYYDSLQREHNEAAWEYEQRRLARADERGNLEQEASRKSRSVFSDAESDISAAGDAPGYVAYTYASRMADIKAFVKADMLDEAASLYHELNNLAVRDHSRFKDMATSRPDPSNKFQEAVNAGGYYLSSFKFKDEVMELSDNTTVTAATLFGSSNVFDRYQQNRLIRAGFSESFATTFANSGKDPLKKSILTGIANPVLTFSRTRPGMSHPATSQFSDLGDYLVHNWDDLVSELGQRGVERLVMAGKKAAESLTTIDTVENVRKLVSQQRNTGPGTDAADGFALVRDADAALDRVTAMMDPDGKNDPKARRFSMKVLSSCIEEAGKQGGSVDLTDPDVLGRMKELAVISSAAESMRIPLLVMGHEKGHNDMRKQFYDYVKGGSESNIYVRFSNLMKSAPALLSSGMTVDRNGNQTTGNMFADNIIKGLSEDLVRSGASGLAVGKREDIAIYDSISDGSLPGAWTTTLRTWGGFSETTAGYLAGRLASAMAASGQGLTPIDVSEVLANPSAISDAPEGVRKELLRWYKGANMVANVMEPYMNDYMMVCLNGSVGLGLTPNQFSGEWARVLKHAAQSLEEGRDPTGKGLKKIMDWHPYFLPSGNYIIQGVPRPVSREEYIKYVRSVTEKNNADVSIGDVNVSRVAVLSARPEVIYHAKPADYNDVTRNLVPIPGVIDDVSGLNWSDPAGKQAVLNYMDIMKQIYTDNNRMNMETQKSASRKVVSEMSDSDDELSMMGGR